MVNQSRSGRVGMALAVVFLILQLYLVFIRTYETMDLEVYPNVQPSPDLRSGFAVGQTFQSRTDRLCRIDVLMGTHRRTLEGEMVLRLREWPFPAGAAADVRTVRVQGAAIKDNLYQTFAFAPIPDSRGKTYAFEIRPEESANPEIPGLVWMNPNDIYPGGSILLGGLPAGGDCTFRTYASRTVAASVGRIVAKRPGPLGSPLFFWLALLALEAALTALLWRLPRIFADPDRVAPAGPGAEAKRP